MANSVRLQDVADMAGVSIGTASQALNNRPSVAPETRARVVDAARTLGYPLKNAFDTAQTSLEVIGMLTKHDYGEQPDVNPFYSHVQAGVESACRECQLSLMYTNIEVDKSNHPVVWPAMMSEQRVDGLLLIGTFIEDTVDWFKRHLDAPIVLIDSYAPELPFDSVVIENIAGAATAIDYLVKRGHSRIGLIGTNPQSPPSVLERRTGYRRACRRHRLDSDYIEDSYLSQEEGYAATERLLQRCPEVTAIFAAADLVALGAMRAARDLGLHVPGDLAIIGFDNIDLAGMVLPSLTTIHVHKTWMGTLGVRQLIERARYPEQPKTTITLATQLIVRESA